MRIRSGFVSNSSSSSFVCDVCGTSESGMDASASDFEMSLCKNGHTFCDCHAENLSSPSFEQIRSDITEMINGYKYSSPEDKAVQLTELRETDDEDLKRLLKDFYSDDGVSLSQCPVCSFTKLTDRDGYTFLKKKFSLTNEDVIGYIKAGFKTYSEFQKYLYPPKK